MAKPPLLPNTAETNPPTNICGIVMPISSIGDEYSEEHWRRVRKVLQRAIERAGLKPKLVWDNAEIDVIQSAILQNIYENDVVICDLSGLNSNVMLEAGLRLSTRKPTIIVTDKVHKPPFDVSSIGYIEYQKDLEYNNTEEFIERLSKKILSVSEAFDNGTYQSFVQNFKFETVSPQKVEVSPQQFFSEQISSITQAIRRLESNFYREANSPERTQRLRSRRYEPILVKAYIREEASKKLEMEIDIHDLFQPCRREKISENEYNFYVELSDLGNRNRVSALDHLKAMVSKAEEDDLPF